MYCPNCGKELKEKSKFCIYCGCKIENIDIYEEEKVIKLAPNLKKNSKELPKNKTFLDNMSKKKLTLILIGIIITTLLDLGSVLFGIAMAVFIYSGFAYFFKTTILKKRNSSNLNKILKYSFILLLMFGASASMSETKIDIFEVEPVEDVIQETVKPEETPDQQFSFYYKNIL